MTTTENHASMADVARLAGVSVSTVSRALRGSALVSAETTERVSAAAAELSFAISRVASSLASGRLGRIGVLVGGSLQAWFNGSILDAIYEQLHAADNELLIFRIQNRAEREEFFTRLPARRNVDAMIVASFALTDIERQRLQDLGMPVVYLNQRVRGVPSVSIDDAAGAQDGVRHLMDLGHRRIAFVRAANRTGFSYSAIERIEGFRSAMSEAGVSPSEQMVITTSDLDRADEVTAAVLAAGEPPTALAADSDELAIGVLAACSRVGLRVPDDLSLIGFDDHALAERMGLSTVAQPVEALGTQAATMALALAAGDTLPREVVLVPTRLVLRRTTSRRPE